MQINIVFIFSLFGVGLCQNLLMALSSGKGREQKGCSVLVRTGTSTELTQSWLSLCLLPAGFVRTSFFMLFAL